MTFRDAAALVCAICAAGFVWLMAGDLFVGFIGAVPTFVLVLEHAQPRGRR